jgi:hypothetical protein
MFKKSPIPLTFNFGRVTEIIIYLNKTYKIYKIINLITVNINANYCVKLKINQYKSKFKMTTRSISFKLSGIPAFNFEYRGAELYVNNKQLLLKKLANFNQREKGIYDSLARLDGKDPEGEREYRAALQTELEQVLGQDAVQTIYSDGPTVDSFDEIMLLFKDNSPKLHSGDRFQYKRNKLFLNDNKVGIVLPSTGTDYGSWDAQKAVEILLSQR